MVSIMEPQGDLSMPARENGRESELKSLIALKGVIIIC
jgi:hypothetical protein